MPNKPRLLLLLPALSQLITFALPPRQLVRLHPILVHLTPRSRHTRRRTQTTHEPVTHPETPPETPPERLRNPETAAETWGRSTRPTAGVRTRPRDGCYRGHSWPSCVGAREIGVPGLVARPADPR